jgi:hypothetical protein
VSTSGPVIASRIVRILLLSAVIFAACGGTPQRARAPRVVVIRPIEAAATPAGVASVDERVAEARAELAGDELLAEHRERLDGEARLHFVLERGRCYRVWVGADGPIDARIEDEHGHAVARGEGWLGEVCPRWSGSFALAVTSREDARALAVLLAGRAADPE